MAIEQTKSEENIEEEQINDQADVNGDKKKKDAKKQDKQKKNRRPRRRMFPIWLRIIVVIVLCSLALIIGSMIGYGVVGDGKILDALDIDVWRHIVDIVVKES